jgi:large subunit ribosomal protein L15
MLAVVNISSFTSDDQICRPSLLLHIEYCDQRETMASKPSSRSLQAITRRARPSCQCAGWTSSWSSSIRQFSASSLRPEAKYENEPAERPRWSYTPQAMKAPYATVIKDPEKAWECNNDPEKLDRFYNKFLGRGGDTVLTDEAKWLAITHKSFDQGRRGFNDRLAFFGKFSQRLVTITY